MKIVITQGPVYVEKRCSGKEGHPPSRVNFSECLYEKKVDPFARANSTRACFDCLALMELTRLGKPKSLDGEKLAQLSRSPFQPSQLFVSHVNGSPSFVRKCRKSWLAQGSSGMQVTLLPRTTFLHITRA